MRRICVFCGSNAGHDPRYRAEAEQLGRLLAGRGIELVYGAGNVGLMGAIADACLAVGGTVIGVDWRTPLADAWKRIGHDRGIQGNLDPLLLCSPHEVAAKRARAIIAEAGGRPGHIFNLGHGIVPETPVDNVKAMIDLIHSIPLTPQAS